ncbi:MAG: cupin domain-containing protein [Solirubrobacteraceae bacterium]
MGMTHFDEAPAIERELGHLRGRWTLLGDAAGCVNVGVRRIEIPAGGWSTPAHEHGREEEIFYVLAGRGISWHRGRTAGVGEGDCIVYRAHSGAHTLHAVEAVDMLVFGPREYDESLGFPRLGMSLVGSRAVETVPGVVDRAPIQFVREAELGPPELAEQPGPRPDSVVHLDAVEPVRVQRGRVARTRRRVSRAAGSVTTGLQHVVVEPGAESAPQHCHSVEEEIFVILGGDGVLVLDDEETPVTRGHVISRSPSTGVSHMFRAGDDGLTYLAYGTRDPADVCYYPRSNKIAFRGVGVIARLQRLDYWDGED